MSPTIDTQFNATIAAGRNFVRKLSFVDPGKDIWIVKADFGQGLAPIPFDSIKKTFVLDHAFATPGTFTVRAEVFDGISTTLNSFQVEVMPNSAPTVLHPISDKTVTQGLESVSSYVDLAQVFVDSDGPVTELTYAVVSNSNAFLVATSIATGRLNLSINPNNIGTATITVRATDVGGLSVDDTFTVTVLAAQSLQIRSVSPTTTGVQIEFDTVPELSVLNLYDGVDASLDLADVALIGANSGSVRGSLLWNASTNTIEFVKTGGHLVADTYTLTLFSRVDGWKTAAGALLDGDNNGIPGGDLVRTFTVAPTTARIVSIPDFSRGATSTAGQSVNLSYDNGNPGVPVTISDGTGVLAIDFDVVYNPALINFSSTFFGVLPSGWSTTVNLVSTGRMRLTLSGTTPLAAGPQVITRLLASVPANTPYGASDLVKVEALAVYTDTGRASPVPSMGDAGLHKAVFVGDTNGDGQYTAQDAGWTSGVVVGAYSGFDAYSWTDPSIVANVNQNGGLDGLDSSWIARKGLSNELQPEIPNLPVGSITVQSGVDPTIATDALVATRRGAAVNMPIRVTDSASGLWGVDVFLDYNTNLLDLASGLNVGGVTLAGMFITEAGWTIDSFADDATGKLRIAAYRATPSASTSGIIANVAFQVKPNAAFGVTPILVGGNANVPPFSFSFVSGSVNVIDSPPTDITLNQNTVLENTSTAAADLLFGQLGTVDLDPVDSYIYDLLTGAGDTDNARFRIVDDKVFIKQGEILDFEAKPSYSVRIRTTDSGGLFYSRQVTLNLTDVNESVVLTRANANVAGNVLTQFANSGTWSDPESGPVTLTASLGVVTKIVDGTWSWSYRPSAMLIGQVVTISANDGTNVSTTTFTIDANVAVTNQQVFYKGSSYASVGGVDAALDSGKVLVQSGTTRPFSPRE